MDTKNEEIPCVSIPNLTTSDVQDITENSVVFSGVIEPENCTTKITSQGFVYSENKLPKITDFVVEINGTTISKKITGLKQDQVYYYRTFATNSSGTYYGNEITFKTNKENSKLLIKKIQNENPASYEKGSQFFYEDDKLTFIYLNDCSGLLYYFEYNSNGKISKRFEGSASFNGDTFDPNTFDLSNFKENSSILNFIYENSRLVKIQRNNGFVEYIISYDDDNNINVIEWLLPNIGLWEKIVLTYSNGKISNLNDIQFNTGGGSILANYNYSFEYDDKINPFKPLKDNYSMLFITTCTGLDYITEEGINIKLFDNNVTKVFKEGELIYSATYQYNNDYPTRISYVDSYANNSGVHLITY